MDVNVGMSLQECLDLGGLMRRKIVGNDVDLLAAGLIGHYLGEKGDEFLAGVTGHRLAEHLAAAIIEGGVKGQGAVAVSIRSRGVPADQATAAAPDQAGPGPESRSFRLRKTPPRVAAG